MELRQNQFRFSVALVALTICGGAFAQASLKPIKGVQEFSGRLIVKAKMESAFAATGLSTKDSATLRYKAVLALEKNTLRREAATDEYIVSVPSGMDDATYSQKLMATGAYEYASPDWNLAPAKTPNDPLLSYEWHHKTMHSFDAWNSTTGSTALKIAVCDTGVDATHPDLKDNLLPGYNAVTNKTAAQGGETKDINGHGTHCAGCAGAKADNKIGVAGVLWTVKILPVRVTNQTNGSASLADILRGVRWAVDNGAKSISVSYSGADNATVQTTGEYAKSKGALLLWAAGNDARNLSGFDHKDVIIVGASDQKDAKASFSAYGKAIDVFAPGVAIASTVMGGGYEAWSGTSMATPLANGVVGLIFAANPKLNVSQGEDILFKSCVDLGEKGNDDVYGWGRIDAYAAVKLALSTTGKTAFVLPVGSRAWLLNKLSYAA